MLTHKELFPEQYAHPLCGKTVRYPNGKQGIVERVATSRFGQIVHLVGYKATDTVYRVQDCKVVQEDSANGDA